MTLHRELLEETGHEPLSVEPFADACQYVFDASTGRCWNKLCASLSVVRVGSRTHVPTERSHAAAWLAAPQAAGVLHEEASAWAVRRALEDMG